MDEGPRPTTPNPLSQVYLTRVPGTIRMGRECNEEFPTAGGILHLTAVNQVFIPTVHFNTLHRRAIR